MVSPFLRLSRLRTWTIERPERTCVPRGLAIASRVVRTLALHALRSSAARSVGVAAMSRTRVCGTPSSSSLMHGVREPRRVPLAHALHDRLDAVVAHLLQAPRGAPRGEHHLEAPLDHVGGLVHAARPRVARDHVGRVDPRQLDARRRAVHVEAPAVGGQLGHRLGRRQRQARVLGLGVVALVRRERLRVVVARVDHAAPGLRARPWRSRPRRRRSRRLSSGCGAACVVVWCEGTDGPEHSQAATAAAGVGRLLARGSRAPAGQGEAWKLAAARRCRSREAALQRSGPLVGGREGLQGGALVLGREVAWS